MLFSSFFQFYQRAPLVVLLASLVSFAIVIPAQAQIADLSIDWQEGALYNQNKAYCAIQAALSPAFIRGYIVIQDGLLVAEGYTEGNEANDKNEVYSVTKAWSTFLIGVLVDQGKLSISETLQDIFDQAADWEGVHQASEKKAITVSEILTMSSGLKESPLAFCQFDEQDSLQKTLNNAKYYAAERGKFNYLATTNTLAHIILRRSGETPREFATSSGVFDALGMNPDNFDWSTINGLETTSGGLQANPRVLAKLGQLYLQDGAASTTNQLVSSNWVDMATTDQKSDDSSDDFGQIYDGYGYHWKVPKNGETGDRAGIAAATGAFGQYVVFLPATNTVIAVTGNPSCPVSFYNNILFIDTAIENLNGLSEEQDDADDCEDSYSKWKYCTSSFEKAAYCGVCPFPWFPSI